MTASKLRARLRNRRSEHGVSLIEVMVVTLLLGIVLGVAFSTLVSVTNVTARFTNGATVVNEARLAVETMTRDIRAASPQGIQSLPSGAPFSTYDTQIPFYQYCDTGSPNCTNNQRSISYQLTGNTLYETVGTGGSQVTRPVIQPLGPSSLPEASQVGAVLHDTAHPIFQYYTADGTKLSTSETNPSTQTSFNACVKTVEIQVSYLTVPNDLTKLATIDTKVDLRNFNPLGC